MPGKYKWNNKVRFHPGLPLKAHPSIEFIYIYRVIGLRRRRDAHLFFSKTREKRKKERKKEKRGSSRQIETKKLRKSIIWLMTYLLR